MNIEQSSYSASSRKNNSNKTDSNSTSMNIRKSFVQALSSIYEEREANAIFFLVVEHLTGLSVAQQLAHDSYGLNEKTNAQLNNILDKLKSYVPVQYALNEAVFCGLTFKVNKNVLIPRPETEQLVDLIVKLYEKSNFSNILDIGTGSGCIAISLAHFLPASHVTACDISPAALKTAESNADLNSTSIEFITADANFLSESELSNRAFELIVSNPPYVMDSEKNNMTKSVLDFEPHMALFVSDEDPLIFYRNITDFASSHLTPKGILAFEINEALGPQTLNLINSFDFKKAQLIKDSFSKDRFIIAYK